MQYNNIRISPQGDYCGEAVHAYICAACPNSTKGQERVRPQPKAEDAHATKAENEFARD